MTSLISSLFYKLIGNPKTSSLEHRLFSTISLFNGISNLAGSYGNLFLYDSIFLSIMNIVTGILFLVFYFLSRFRSLYYSLYWPFVILILSFLFVSLLGNAGSSGGTHYYFIPSLVIAMILSRKRHTTIIAVLLHIAVTACIFMIEFYKPEWITHYSNDSERMMDVAGQFVFVQIFTGLLVLILSRSFHDEKMKSEKLLLNILPESIADELKQTDRVKPKLYESATVMFTDFVGFTKIAENLQPSELVSELDRCFGTFDNISKKYGLEKIKTIGDAYMAAGGIPEI
ncbi:MAG: adenylate/guanylate cyclase domain-containing protein, partial [Spirochaetia bacterium]|nr:adenylate/guanylate cyclase domain-containing protein [Spirochaetia bacterium]